MARFSFKPLFTATPLQVTTYLFGVALFSISFLVFLNASVSFVITDLIGQRKKVGDAVGTLGFADELIALIACPLWGLLSDRIGVRTVCVCGYSIIGISMFIFVQAKNVYPQLLLARLCFSVGGAATSTMVTAILPAMTSNYANQNLDTESSHPPTSSHSHHTPSFSTASEATITPAAYRANLPFSKPGKDINRSSTSQIAGLVGTFTGLGALLALGVFLPLPARLSKSGHDRAQAVKESFYIVGSISLAVGIVCFIGLRHIAGDERKQAYTTFNQSASKKNQIGGSIIVCAQRFAQAVKLGFVTTPIGLGYLGGFVARASSVAITLFIPLYVNSYFIRNGLCSDDPHDPIHDPSDIKSHCRRAYTLAAVLTGVSQVVALVFAPIFGWLGHRFAGPLNIPLLSSALAGVLGYAILGTIDVPDPTASDKGYIIFLPMLFIGVSQIGAIVCSLALLAAGIESTTDVGASSANGRLTIAAQVINGNAGEIDEERRGLLQQVASPDSDETTARSNVLSLHHLKGTIAGVYSLSGGAGILLLTKLGGYLFDNTTPGAPFFMLSVFNLVLLLITAACGISNKVNRRYEQVQ